MSDPVAPANPAERVIASQGFTVTIPSLGRVTIPRTQLAFAGGVAVLAAACIVEWPLAAVLVAGHVLISQQHSATLHALGEALTQQGAD